MQFFLLFPKSKNDKTLFVIKICFGNMYHTIYLIIAIKQHYKHSVSE